MMKTVRLTTISGLALIVALTLIGCGGGGGGVAPGAAASPAPVDGITVTGTARVPDATNAGRAYSKATAAVTGLVAMTAGTIAVYSVDDAGAVKGAPHVTGSFSNGTFALALPDAINSLASDLVMVITSGSIRMRAFITSASDLEINPISEYVVYTVTRNENALSGFSLQELKSVYSEVAGAVVSEKINFSNYGSVSEAVKALGDNAKVATTAQNQITIALPYTIAATVTPSSGMIGDAFAVECNVGSSTPTSLEARCDADQSWSLITSGSGTICTYNAVGKYVPACRVNRMSIDEVDSPVTVGEPAPVTVAASVTPSSGTVEDLYKLTCTVSGGTYDWLEARCDESEQWFLIESGNVVNCDYASPGGYTPGCRVDNDATDDVNAPVVVSDATNNTPVISSVTVSKPVVLATGEYSYVQVTATDPDGDVLSYAWNGNGGKLTKVNNTKYKFSTTEPGEFKVTVTVSDARGESISRTVDVTSFGTSATHGGIKGDIDVSNSVARASIYVPSRSANALRESVTLAAISRRDLSREVRYGNKSMELGYCSGDRFKTGEIVLKMYSDAPAADVAAANGLTVTRQSQGGMALLKADVAGLDEVAAKQLTRDKCLALNGAAGVKYAGLNGIKQKRTVPNDPMYGSQWNYPLLNLPSAWSVTTGSKAVVVAVLDTGIVKAHNDIKNNLIDGYDFVSESDNECDGTGGIDADPEDVSDSRCASGAISTDSYEHSGYHGTHVAGTIGAQGNNGLGVAGVNWNVSIMPVRILGSQGGSDYDIIQGLLYAGGLANDSGTVPSRIANVINMSIGGEPGEPCPAQYNDLFDQLHARGISVFVASGNESSDNALNPLALCNHAIAVGAVDRNSVKTSYSNGGPGLDVMAPGGDSMKNQADGILSTIRDDDNNNSTSYAYYDGTSMATPHAAGVGALLYAAYPDITPDQVATILAQTATDLGAPGTDNLYGAGLINAYKAVQEAKALAGGGQTDPPAIAVSPTSLSFTENDNSKQIIITNGGDGDLTITSVTDTESTGGNWLSTTYQASGSSFTLTATVNRNGLSEGTYTGGIEIKSNGGNKIVSVTMQVGQDTQPPQTCANPEIYVLSIAPDTCTSDTCDTVAQTELSESGGDYAMFAVEAGDHYVVAGTDCNGDFSICDQEVDKCGMYPVVHAPTIVTTSAKSFTNDVNFEIAPGFIQSATLDSAPSGSLVNPSFKRLR